MAGYDLLMIFWSGFLIFGLFMAYQDYRKWITSNEANKSLSLREIFSIFGQGIVFVGIALAWCPEVESNHRHKDFQSFALPTELSGQSSAQY